MLDNREEDLWFKYIHSYHSRTHKIHGIEKKSRNGSIGIQKVSKVEVD